MKRFPRIRDILRLFHEGRLSESQLASYLRAYEAIALYHAGVDL